jgi:hypothetical protein
MKHEPCRPLRIPWRWHVVCLFAVCSGAFNIYALLTHGGLRNAGATFTGLAITMLALRWARNRQQRPTPSRRNIAPILIFLCLGVAIPLVPANTALAQTASPTPPTLKPQPTPSWEAGLPGGQMTELLDHVRELVPYIRRQVERPLMEKFNTLGMIVASLVLLFSFIRIIRENDGASSELYYWIARAAIFMFLFTLAPSIISTMYKVGRTLTTPLENGIEERRSAFNDTYYEFIHGTMIVKDGNHVFNDPLALKPGEDGWAAVLTDGESGHGKLKGIQELNKAADVTSWHMDWLFFLLNIARGILQFGEVFLLLLSGFVMIALRLASPFMVAVGTDKKLAERVTYPFVWGTVVFTAIFPVVRDVIIYVAYTVGSFGLMLYKGEAIYTIDDKTAELLKNNYYDPKFIIIISLVTMTVSGLCLWLSPYIAYRFATGQVFEAVSSTASGWMSAIVGSAIEFAGLKAGASIQRQAENTTIQGGYSAEMTRARATMEVGNIGAQARQISGLASIQGGLAGQLGAIWGGAHTTIGTAMQMRNFTVASTNAQVGDSQRQTGFRRDQAIGQNNINYGVETVRLSVENEAKKGENAAQLVGGAFPYGGGTIIGEQGFFAQRQRNIGQNAALSQQRMYSNINEFHTSDKIQGSQETFRGNIQTAADNQYAGIVQATNEGAGMAAGAAKHGAGIASGGVNKAYQLELKANEVQFTGAKDAAAITRDAGFEAARDRQIGTIITSMSRDMSRRLEEAGKQRY